MFAEERDSSENMVWEVLQIEKEISDAGYIFGWVCFVRGLRYASCMIRGGRDFSP